MMIGSDTGSIILRQWFNQIFLQHKFHFLLQSLLIAAFIFFVLMGVVSDKNQGMTLLSAIGISSLSSSAFTLFVAPHSPMAHPRRVLGAYTIAVLCGMIWHELAIFFIYKQDVTFNMAHAIAGAFSAMSAMLLMAIFDFEHPPAMGFSVGLGVQFWDSWLLLVVSCAVILLCLLKILLRNWLVSLV